MILWQRYLSCDGSPDPTVLRELNTFLSLWREEQDEDVQLVMEKGAQVLKLIENLQLLLMDTPPPEMAEKEAVQYQESILELQTLLRHKYNGATQQLLKTASMYEDSETGNMQAVIKDKNVTFCIWVNLKKKVRFKSHMFTDAQHGFDLPKSLALSSVAVRILHTRYDHVSPLWLLCQGLPNLETLESKEASEHPKDSAEEPGEEGKKPREEPSVGAGEETGPEGRKVQSFRKEQHSTIATGEDTERKSAISDRSSQEGDLRLQEETRNKAEAPAEAENVDLKQFVPVGGVFHIDALQIPPQVIEVRDWSMVEAALAELKAYQQMALVASAFAFASSKWNGAAGPEHVVFQVSEHLEADSVKDSNWSLYMFDGQKAQKLKITESSEAFSEELEEDSEFHSTLYHQLKDFANKGAMERVEAASFLFSDVVDQLLLATRVLTYS
ncbi:dynein axonemal intermediate chain 7-like [Pithys albifrons albifrons]|uniref:dynein axonemal intermediate chain 7-like n=1 Tax=Pithys albifrons albifrons TaxID=3385563 RepID=UPI003A5D0968